MEKIELQQVDSDIDSIKADFNNALTRTLSRDAFQDSKGNWFGKLKVTIDYEPPEQGAIISIIQRTSDNAFKVHGVMGLWLPPGMMREVISLNYSDYNLIAIKETKREMGMKETLIYLNALLVKRDET